MVGHNQPLDSTLLVVDEAGLEEAVVVVDARGVFRAVVLAVRAWPSFGDELADGVERAADVVTDLLLSEFAAVLDLRGEDKRNS